MQIMIQIQHHKRITFELTCCKISSSILPWFQWRN